MIRSIQQWLEKSYRLEPEMPVTRFLIDHAMVLSCLGGTHALAGAEEVVLMRRQAGDIDLGLYFHPAILHANSSHQILTLVEGVSHLLLLLHRLRTGALLSHFELELQAEIDKFLFLRLGGDITCRRASKLHLKKAANLKSLDGPRIKTYEMARRLANRYCSRLEADYLNGHSLDPLWEELRPFYRLSHWDKLKKLGPP